MAIAINGSTNVITGVGVGGLPDGIVDADMLASDAVIAAKIDDGAITAAKMASGVGGKILTSGVGTTTFSGSTASSSFVNATTFDVTPSASSSKILIFGGIQHVQDSTTSWHLAVYRDSTEVFERSQWKFSSTNRNFVILDINLLDSPSTTSQITYAIKVKIGGTSGADAINYGGHYLWFEVAG